MLARGRALAKKAAGASESAYLDALKFQVKTFPDDPATAEARWLLGKVRLAAGDRDEAETLWKALPHSSPRWLDSRLEIAALQLADVHTQRLNGDRSAIREKLEAARAFFVHLHGRGTRRPGDSASRARRGPAGADLRAGRPELALAALDHIQRSVSRGPERDAARRLNLLGLLQASRWIDAEQAARSEIRTSDPKELLETVRLIDRAAAEADTDLKMRRMGLVLRILMAQHQRRRCVALSRRPRRAQTAERPCPALHGDENAARRQMAEWTEPPPSSTNELLRDVAEIYSRLGAHTWPKMSTGSARGGRRPARCCGSTRDMAWR